MKENKLHLRYQLTDRALISKGTLSEAEKPDFLLTDLFHLNRVSGKFTPDQINYFHAAFTE